MAGTNSWKKLLRFSVVLLLLLVLSTTVLVSASTASALACGSHHCCPQKRTCGMQAAVEIPVFIAPDLIPAVEPGIVSEPFRAALAVDSFIVFRGPSPPRLDRQALLSVFLI